jgi:predicted transcriptional regulator
MAIPFYPATYQNPYMQQYQPQQQSGGLIWVQGEAGAKSYAVSAGQSVLLMDSESNRFFIKSADTSGMPLPLRIFDYVERKEATRATESESAATLDVSRFVTHDELEDAIRAILAQTERSAENAE